MATPKLYKASEVCELVQVQPYVLRSWEKEFPGIGVQKQVDGPRLYRQADLDQVRRIKHLVFSEGLTLAGVRRRLEEGGAVAMPARVAAPARAAVPAPVVATPVKRNPDPSPLLEDVLGHEAKARIQTVRAGLKAILEMLSKPPVARSEPFDLKPPEMGVPHAPARAATPRAAAETSPAKSGKRDARSR